MNQDVASIISRLESHARQLILQYSKIKQQLAEAEQQLSIQKQKCEILEKEKLALEDKYSRLKLARMVDMVDDNELKTARQRINKMIASVDKCLATLKVQ